jgi:hypothetical protein
MFTRLERVIDEAVSTASARKVVFGQADAQKNTRASARKVRAVFGQADA